MAISAVWIGRTAGKRVSDQSMQTTTTQSPSSTSGGKKNSNEAQKNDMISNIIITGREVAFSSRQRAASQKKNGREIGGERRWKSSWASCRQERIWRARKRPRYLHRTVPIPKVKLWRRRRKPIHMGRRYMMSARALLPSVSTARQPGQ